MLGEFYIGSHRVVESDSGYWLYPRGGARGRFFLFTSAEAQSIRRRVESPSFEMGQRHFAAGTHEPIYYIRDEHGKAGIPPEPGLPLPAGCTLFEARTLSEVDSLAEEMSRDLMNEVRDDGYATKMIDGLFGNPIEQLKEQARHPISRMEKDVIPLLLEELDRMEYENQHRVEARVRFAERER